MSEREPEIREWTQPVRRRDLDVYFWVAKPFEVKIVLQANTQDATPATYHVSFRETAGEKRMIHFDAPIPEGCLVATFSGNFYGGQRSYFLEVAREIEIRKIGS